MKLIIVDDDHVARDLLREVIQRTLPNAQIIPFALAARALQEIESSKVDLLITDYQMLDMDGATLTRAVRKKQPLLPIIMVSGSDDSQRNGLAAGVNKFISKDHLLKQLPEALKNLMNSHSPRRPLGIPEDSMNS